MPVETGQSSTVKRLAVPPQKIACGFYHSLIISNAQDREDKSKAAQANKAQAATATEAEEKPQSEDEEEDVEKPIDIYAHGANHNNMQGHSVDDSALFREEKNHKVFHEWRKPTRVEGPCVTHVVRNGEMDPEDPSFEHELSEFGEPYEVAAGHSHSMYLFKKREEDGGVLFACGTGLRGRMGLAEPNLDADDEIEDVWFSEKGPYGPIVFNKFHPETRLSVLRVACGSDHTLCYCTDGLLYGFGVNKEGQCGVEEHQDFTDVRMPCAVALPRKEIHHFACGGQHSMAVCGDGELYTWGCGKNGRLGLGRFDSCPLPTRVLAQGDSHCLYVACGEAHSGMIDQEGKVWLWGAGSYGRLGHGEEEDVQVPKQVEAFDEMTETPGQIRILSIALGGFHSLFLEEPAALSGRIFSCGSGPAVGSLSEGDNMSVLVPRVLSDSVFGTKGGIKQMAAGMYHNYVLQENGDLIRWGVGSNGRLGIGEDKVKTMSNPETHKNLKGFAITMHPKAFTHPTEKPVRKVVKKDPEEQEGNANTVKQVTCGAMHTAALIKGGQLYVWGSNSSGQLGLGPDPAFSNVWVPRRCVVGNERKVKEIAAGFEHLLCVTTNAECYSWGKGTSGQLGTGRARDSFEPMLVSGLTQVVKVAAGEEHSAAICLDARGSGELFTWGSAENGMLGLGDDFTSGPQTSPTKVEFTPVQLTAGGQKAAPSSKKAAGKHAAVGSHSHELEPILVRCGSNHTVVVVGHTDDLDKSKTPVKGGDSENKVFAFGGGWYGRLGHGGGQGYKANSNMYAPKQVKFESGTLTLDVGCGATHTCSLNKQGELFAWGKAAMVCEPEDVMLPKKFMGIEGQPQLKAVVCGEMHTCALTEKGELWVWGKNKSGQLGTGAAVDEFTPKQAQIPAACFMLSSGADHVMSVLGGGELYGCGNQGNGRLGLAEKGSGPKEKLVTLPTKVQAEWASIQSMTALAAEKKEAPRTLDDMFADVSQKLDKEKEDEKKPTVTAAKEDEQAGMLKVLQSGQKVATFGTMQMLIKQEKQGSRPAALKALETKLETRLKTDVEDIKNLASKEVELGQLESDLQQSLESNMRWFKSCTTPETGNLRVSEEVLRRLPVYEEVLWVLQVQVCYFTRLGLCMEQADEENRQVFYRCVKGVYRNAENSTRARHLLLMCIRLMFVTEVDLIPRLTVENAFDKKTSRAFVVFSEFALSRMHWEDLLHKYMKIPGKGDDSAASDTLIVQLKNTVDRSETFAIGMPDFKQVMEALGEGRKEGSEAQALLVGSQEALKNFMLKDFIKSVIKVDLPWDIKLLLNSIHNDVGLRQPACPVDLEISQELKMYEPLLYLFCHGIMIPMLRDCKTYCGKQCLLNSSAPIVNGANEFSNIQRVANFLERMIEDRWELKEMKQLGVAAKQVKLQLLQYLQKQVAVNNDLEANILVETYSAHFDRTRHMVFLQISDMMKLSNMLKKYDSQLRLSESDKLASLMDNVPKWSPAEIQESEEPGVDSLVNFKMNSRFLMTTVEEVVICPTSTVIVPQSMASNGALKGYFKTYTLDNPDDPRRALESLFLELEVLNGSTFEEMAEEFEKLRKSYRDMGSPNYELMQRLQDGLRIIEELGNVQAHPEDVLEFLSKQLIQRDAHYTYLKKIESGMTTMDSLKTKYKTNLNTWKRELELALDRSRELSLPEQFNKVAAGSMGGLLKFKSLEKATNKRLFKPEDTKKLNLAYTPIKVYPLKKLEKQGIVTEVFPPFKAEDIKKTMNVTFRSTPAEPGGGVQLVVNIVKKSNTTTVKTISVPESVISEMKTAEKGAKAPLGNPGEDPFMTVDSSQFVDLCTQLSQSTGTQ